MATPCYTIEIVQPELLIATFSGFWSAADQAAFAPEMTAATARLARRNHLVLVDLRDFEIQSQDVVASFADYAATGELLPRRVALVTKSALGAMQARRAVAGLEVATFRSLDNARAWLLDESRS